MTQSSVYEEIIFEDGVIPLKRLEEIKNVQYGTNAKILIPFSKPPLKRMALFNDCIGCFFDVNRCILTLYYTDVASRFTVDTIFDAYKQDRPMIEAGFENVCPPLIAPLFARDQSFGVYEGAVGYSWPNDP